MRYTFKRIHVITGGALTVCALGVGLLAAREDQSFFDTADSGHKGYVTRDEFRADMTRLLPQGGTQQQLAQAFDRAFPESVIANMLRTPGPQNQTPKAEDVTKMEAALPSSAAAQPAKARRVLVLSKAAGYVHSCIPLAAKTVEELGSKTGAWTTTVSYDSAVITADNLKQYDLVFLNNTTGAFLDDADAAVTAARKQALLEFVRSGKGLAGIHAASDSYHKAEGSGAGMGPMLAGIVMGAADTNKDKQLSAEELGHYSDSVFDSMDKTKSGQVSDADLHSKLLFAFFNSGRRPQGGAPAMPAQGRSGMDPQVGTWPEFNRMIGGYFKYHWLNPQHIVYKIDDPKSPLTAMLQPRPFSVDDETYTFGMRSWSRKNLHVLASIDYAQMSDADKRKEDYPRTDHDYGLSWVRREGQGRVFYMAHGHDEHIYAMKPMLEHLLAGIQYALGDLKADDSPSE